MREAWSRILPALVVVIFGTSCVPPSCFDQAYGSSSPNDKALVVLTLFSEPIPGATGPAMWQRFESGASITIRQTGRMAVSTLSMWPQQCPTVPEEDLLEVSRVWEPVVQKWEPTLRKMAENSPYPSMKQAPIHRLAKPFTGMEGWEADGPLVELSLQFPSGKTLQLLWDGTPLPPDLDTSVMSTLEIACSNSRLARKYLAGGLPPQVSSRLKCQAK